MQRTPSAPLMRQPLGARRVDLRLLVALGCIALLSSAASSGDAKRTRPASLQDLNGVWIGGTVGSELEFVRLQLDAAGKGNLVVSFLPDAPVRAYHVTSVDLDRAGMTCHLSPADSASEPIALHGRFHFSHMDLEMRGVNPKWRRDLYLRRQDGFMKRLKQLEERADALP